MHFYSFRSAKISWNQKLPNILFLVRQRLPFILVQKFRLINVLLKKFTTKWFDLKNFVRHWISRFFTLCNIREYVFFVQTILRIKLWNFSVTENFVKLHFHTGFKVIFKKEFMKIKFPSISFRGVFTKIEIENWNFFPEKICEIGKWKLLSCKKGDRIRL